MYLKNNHVDELENNHDNACINGHDEYYDNDHQNDTVHVKNTTVTVTDHSTHNISLRDGCCISVRQSSN